jgi:hypothetical protein
MAGLIAVGMCLSPSRPWNEASGWKAMIFT